MFFLFFGYAQQHEPKIPASIAKSIPKLSSYLCMGVDSEREKVQVIYNWVISNIEYDYDRLKSTDYFTGVDPEKILKSKKAICTGYVELIKAMLDEVGIESQTIDGYVRDQYWAPGHMVVVDEHSWMAIKIDGEWQLADPTWDAGYIGRLPIDRKPYKPKKYIKNSWKDKVKEEKVMVKRAKKEVERKERYDEKPTHKDKIGFVSEPGHDNFLVHPDTFLLTHLPVNPMWQLRSDIVSIEDFSKGEDSVQKRLETKGNKNLDYKREIGKYQEMDFLHQLIEDAERGLEFNPYNPSVKALGYYNFLSLIHNKKMQRLARGSRYEIRPVQYAELYAMNDTVIKYMKMYKKTERDQNKDRTRFDKDKFKVSSTKSKDNRKLITSIINEHEKLTDYVERSNEKIEDNFEKLGEMKASIEEKFPDAINYVEPKFMKEELVKPWKDSMQMQLDSLKLIQKELKLLRDSTNFEDLLLDLEYIKFYVSANLEMIKENNYLYNDVIDKLDSATSARSNHALMLYNDSLRLEIVDRNVSDVLREAKNYARKARTYFKALEIDKELSESDPYEEYMQAQLIEVIELSEEIYAESYRFNEAVLNAIERYRTVKEIQKLIEEELDLKEEKLDYITEENENRHERSQKLIEKVSEDNREWKEMYKPKR